MQLLDKMKKILKHIGLILGMIMVLSSCGRKNHELIPRNQLAEIYAEMLVTDQWILNTPGVRMIADTSLVYAPILEKYGYSTEDYIYTVDIYMNDPERFAKVLRTSGEILEARLKGLKEQKKLQEERLRKKNEIDRFIRKYRVTLDSQEYRKYLFEEPYLHYYDSLAFEADSVSGIYRLKSIETADTLYDCIRMVFPIDSSAIAVVPEVPVEEVKDTPVESLKEDRRPARPKDFRPPRRLPESELKGARLPEKIKR